jgi:hypothetical protein
MKKLESFSKISLHRKLQKQLKNGLSATTEPGKNKKKILAFKIGLGTVKSLAKFFEVSWLDPSGSESGLSFFERNGGMHFMNKPALDILSHPTRNNLSEEP